MKELIDAAGDEGRFMVSKLAEEEKNDQQNKGAMMVIQRSTASSFPTNFDDIFTNLLSKEKLSKFLVHSFWHVATSCCRPKKPSETTGPI